MQAESLTSAESAHSTHHAMKVVGDLPAAAAKRVGNSRRVVRGLGWFSVAVGTVEIVAPMLVGRLAGSRRRATSPTLLRLFGLRELASGVGILLEPRSSKWLWARVAGDAMDLAALGRTLASPRNERGRTVGAMACVLGIGALDVLSAIECMRNERRGFAKGIDVSSAITVNRSRSDVYQFWRNIENLPRFMAHLESVEQREGRSIWRARGPMGKIVQWEAQIVTDVPDERLSWRSVEGSEVPNEGSVEFLEAPAARGTEVRVELRYDPPAGALGAAMAKLFGADPAQAIAGDLRRFKQVIETGEVVHSDASIHRGMHAARPAAPSEKVEQKGSHPERERSSEGKGRQVAR